MTFKNHLRGYRLIFTQQASSDLAKLDNNTAKKIIKKLDGLLQVLKMLM